jgi:hypothetical protein
MNLVIVLTPTAPVIIERETETAAALVALGASCLPNAYVSAISPDGEMRLISQPSPVADLFRKATAA